MATRPLRQFYGDELDLIAPGPPEAVFEPWTRHRSRFLTALGQLDDDQWRSTTRCEDWDAIGVLWHLITADQFWAASISSGAVGNPTAFLADFDPTTTPGAISESARKDSPAETLAAMVEVDTAFRTAVDAIDGEQWELPAESPIGHVPVRLALSHAFWDSWLHERDILVPLGLETEPEPDELWNAAWYSLVAAAAQGGLIGDERSVAPGPEEPFTVRVTLEEFPDRTLELRVDEGVSVTETDEAGTGIGSALALVEYFTGRAAEPVGTLPGPLAEHLDRARQIL
ncbi:MAG: maleylpyruvate isomerase N-terminal domain-containing protein [Microthrixaceae bacterium]